uniref:Mersacidin/lichenicidin family type 2 lantibiotic n=1 Tax=Haemonchus contortus TaxID=6289 RepID=W6NA37_HAECO
MKLLKRSQLKPEDLNVAVEKASDTPLEKAASEESVSKLFSEDEPSLGTKITSAVKSTAVSIWEWKKDTCCLMPQNCCLLSDKCCLSKLPCFRQLRDKLVPGKEAEA